ncbi:MAG: AlpA family phage regulatory protein [Bradyrhizobium sp.]|nr:AlpA family phage regulatory protein [Bradyrhizobium sp.]
MTEPLLLFPEQLDALTGICDRTRMRMEKRDLFPRRVKISPQRIAWCRSDIDEGAGDPGGWA